MAQTRAGRNWYVAFTKPRSEATAKYYLCLKGIEVFYPKLLIPLSNKAIRRSISLFPSYIFIRIDIASQEYSQVIWCRGIKRLVSFGGVPAPIEEDIIAYMQAQADEDGLIVAKSKLKSGHEVQVCKGAFAGLVGIIQEPPNRRRRVKLLMNILSRQIQVEVPAAYVDMGWVASRPIA